MFKVPVCLVKYENLPIFTLTVLGEWKKTQLQGGHGPGNQGNQGKVRENENGLK